MAGHADAGGWCRLTFARAVIQGQKKARSGSGLFDAKLLSLIRRSCTSSSGRKYVAQS